MMLLFHFPLDSQNQLGEFCRNINIRILKMQVNLGFNSFQIELCQNKINYQYPSKLQVLWLKLILLYIFLANAIYCKLRYERYRQIVNSNIIYTHILYRYIVKPHINSLAYQSTLLTCAFYHPRTRISQPKGTPTLEKVLSIGFYQSKTNARVF